MQHSIQPRPASIQSLPVELIQEIFLCSTALKFERFTPESPVPPRFSLTALALSHVCTYWHAIALTFPELWASIAVCCPTDHIVDLTYLYIERSGESTFLDLELIDVMSHLDLYAERQVALNTWGNCSYEILELWISQAHRWTGINFRLEHIRPFADFCEIPTSSLQNLKRASLNLSTCGWESKEIQHMWDKVYASEQLQEVHSHCGLVKQPPLSTFRHVTDLYAFSLSLEDIAALSSRTRLVKLAMWQLDISPGNNIVELPALEFLTIESLSDDSSMLFERISAPKLHHLTIQMSVELSDVSALYSFLLRTKCDLRHLQIRFYRTSEFKALEYVQLAAPLLPRLKHFAMRMWWLSETTINALRPYAQDGHMHMLLPQVDELCLGSCRLEDGLVGKMISERVGLRHPLEKLRVWFNNEGTHNSHLVDMSTFDGLRETGAVNEIECIQYPR